MYRQYIYAKCCSIVHKKAYHISSIFKKLTSGALDNTEYYFYLEKRDFIRNLLMKLLVRHRISEGFLGLRDNS